MTASPLKRQPRGVDPMEQRSYKLPQYAARWLRAKAHALGITEARFLVGLIDREIAAESRTGESERAA